MDLDKKKTNNLAIRTTEIRRLPMSLHVYDKYAYCQGRMGQLHGHLSGMRRTELYSHEGRGCGSRFFSI